ncbi:NAD(P)H-hydrate epimerase [Neisseria animalis]|uniref:NAD(P)H-hydrate epimerase n=1 Tax=Neisseria animalis TaxID=492 RepID=A0A5P3MNZ9_NEIAN|nr:NAD(P)H-hydrate epimerase [Neisseria animalis]QEY23130.1 NAD(P)H-hydrate epimerase [Neisseria animalis]ROW32461.1 NAD(P)H-hydrate epimerase [Neisseria animalis]VEE08202.1 Nicotinamide nucleotide repair protein [Neisseria animalis]
MKTYTAAQMREHEQMAVDKGTTFEQLMENAGHAAAADLLQRRPQPGRVLMVCGKGNNGGDALVMARVLQAHGWMADVVLAAGNTLSELAALNLGRLKDLPSVCLIDWNEAENRLTRGYDVVVEGIFGTGFSGALPEHTAAVCRRLNFADGLKVALDIPTGLDCDSGTADKDAFCADVTYTFAAYKPAHFTKRGKTLCGEIVCLDIGID